MKRLGIRLTATFLALAIAGAIGLASIKPYKVYAHNNYSDLVGIRYASEEEVEQRRRERDAALAEASAAAAQVSALSEESATLTGELANLNALNEEQLQMYEIISAQYAAALVAKAEALDRYVAAQEDLAAKQLQFSERLSVMFEYQNKSTLEILLSSDNIAGFFTNLEIIALIADADDQAVNQMQVALAEAEIAADLALQEALELEAVVEETQDELDRLANGIALTEEQLAAVNNSLASWQEAEMSAYAVASSLDAQISQMQAEIEAERIRREQAQNTPTPVPSTPSDPTPETPVEPGAEPTSTPVPTPTPTPAPSSGSGMFIWPLYEWDYISDEFGYRYHPLTGEWKGHHGMDIAARAGNTIIAAASGTVCYMEYPVPGQTTGGSGYGNYVIINHGNGVYTLYGHCRDLYVTNGQYVSQGEAIGAVGSTGGSTGSHLHFECRTGSMWGTPTNPRDYL